MYFCESYNCTYLTLLSLHGHLPFYVGRQTMLGSIFCGSDADIVGPGAWPQFPSNEVDTGGDMRNKCALGNETMQIIITKPQ